MDGTTVILVISVLIVVAIFAILATLISMFRKVGPNQALIVYGFGGTNVVVGRGIVVWPMIQNARELSLELMSFDVAPQQDLYTKQGVAVNVEAVAQIKVKSDRESILTAAEQFLSKEPVEREALIRLVMEGHLRGIVGQLTVESIVKEPEMVGEKMRLTAADDLNKMGLEVISFTIREVRDKNKYIENMGTPDIARIRRDADIASAEAMRDTAIKQADTQRESALARAHADQERVIAETASMTRQSEAQRDLSLKQAEYEATVKRAQAQADKAYDIQSNVMQQQVMAEQIRVERVQREGQIEVQQAEIKRRELELVATVLKAADAERQRVQTIAEAERHRATIEANGLADATRAQGQAEADVAKARGTAAAEVTRLQGQAAAEIARIQGLAEAEVVQARGEAEAAAMRVKAAAFQHYNQAAILDKVMGSIPEVARAIAAPLANVDKITIVSTGGGESGATSQLTGDIARMVAQAPALIETLTGQKISDLMARLPAVGGGEPSANGSGVTTKVDAGS